jgi:hypothetical protein
MSPPRPSHLALLLLLSSGACTSQTTDNFEDPPPGPPAACTPDPAVADCNGGSLGYTCAGDRPDRGDTNLVCSDGEPAANGMTSYCCAPYGQYWSDCTVDTGIAGCEGSSFGFKCTGPETPSQADASLACSAGVPSGGDLLYCCNAEVLPPACAPCRADGAACVGCEGAAIPYRCAPVLTPDGLDPSLVCAPGPSELFCCGLGG